MHLVRNGFAFRTEYLSGTWKTRLKNQLQRFPRHAKPDRQRVTDKPHHQRHPANPPKIGCRDVSAVVNVSPKQHTCEPTTNLKGWETSWFDSKWPEATLMGRCVRQHTGRLGDQGVSADKAAISSYRGSGRGAVSGMHGERSFNNNNNNDNNDNMVLSLSSPIRLWHTDQISTNLISLQIKH